jgi:hypothetical protein
LHGTHCVAFTVIDALAQLAAAGLRAGTMAEAE